MEKLAREKSPLRGENIAAAALLAFALLLRLLFIGSLPAGLNQDEASAGYDAWALLNYGIDRCGNALPVLLESWGSGQNALLSYLAMPFIALFGLSAVTLRLPMALVNTASLAALWRTARRAGGPRQGLWALGFLAVCPWHVMASRWALESNLLPAMLMFGVFFAARSEERPRALLGAGASFGLALYAYGTAFFILPPLLIFCVWRLRKSLRAAPFAAGLAIFAALAAPIALCQLRNALGLGETSLLGFTLPALTETRQSAASVLGGGSLAENLKSLARLLITQSDGLPWNSTGFGGIIYIFGLPFALAGLVRALAGRRSAAQSLMLAWFFCSLACSALITVNINRVNMLWLPLAYFTALGLEWLASALGKAYMAVPALLAAAFIGFFGTYVKALGEPGNVNFFPGLGEAIEYVDSQSPESAYISSYVNAPYIFALFYTETPPEDFVSTVVYTNPDGAFRSVESFGVWRFGPGDEAEGEWLILPLSEVNGREIEEIFGMFAVCKQE